MLLATAALPACAPTYPKENVAGALEELCRKEYGLEVLARKEGSTLGILAQVPGLVDELRKQAAGAGQPQMPAVMVEGEYRAGGLDFTVLASGEFARVRERPADGGSAGRKEESEVMKILRHVSTAVQRVSLSTDADVEFYKLIARDPGGDHLDIIFIGHVDDAKRVQFNMISIGDLQFRNVVTARVQPEWIAREKVRSFLQDLGQRSLPQLLAGYAAAPERFGELFPKVLTAAVELKGQQHRLLEEEWPVRQVSPDEVLVYVPLYKLGESGAYLFTVSVADKRGGLADLKRLNTSVLPPRYRKWGRPEEWNDTFYLEPISMTDFITQQIAKRVRAKFEPLEAGDDSQESPRGRAREPADSEDVVRELVETAAYVVRSYDFEDFDRLSVSDLVSGSRWVIPAGDLAHYKGGGRELKPVP